jgi:hypothetical protein
LSGLLRRAGRTGTDGLRPQRRRNARQAGRGGPRRAWCYRAMTHSTRTHHRRWSFRSFAHPSRHRLSRSRKNLARPRRRNRPRGNRGTSRNRTGSRTWGSGGSRRRDARRMRQRNRWRRKLSCRQWRTQRRSQPHRRCRNLLGNFRFGFFRDVLRNRRFGPRCGKLRGRLCSYRFRRRFLAM